MILEDLTIANEENDEHKISQTDGMIIIQCYDCSTMSIS